MEKLSLITRIRRRLQDRSGQSTTEYILILAIVVMIASKMKSKLYAGVSTGVDNISTYIGDETNSSNFK